jgi:CheY-like chemotaxis protein/HPt (histidine-containing phosphotransfer) domain-containing protein
LRECLEESFSLLSPKGHTKCLELAYTLDDDVPPVIVGDVTRLRQVLVNLIGNAIKFTEQGEVGVAVRRVAGSPALHFTVRDTGIGIPAERIAGLFQSFSQVDASTTRRYGGTGLGLAISKRLCELMGGDMWVESELGKGSSFHFTIVAKVAPSYRLPERNVASTLPAGKAEGHALRILLAEDNAVNQKVALLLLERLGYRADVAANGLEVLDALRRQPYDVVLMDVQMPEMDGLEATRQVRRQWPAARQPRIIAMTANAMQGDRERCLDAGMDDYITKPVRVEELAHALSQSKSLVLAQGFTPEPVELAVSAIDASILDALRELGDGSTDILGELVDVYLEDTPMLLTQLHTALETSDAELLQRTAHTLKSSSASLGALRLSDLSRELEALGRSGALGEAPATIAQVEVEYGRVKRALEMECAKV